MRLIRTYQVNLVDVQRGISLVRTVRNRNVGYIFYDALNEFMNVLDICLLQPVPKEMTKLSSRRVILIPSSHAHTLL